MDKKKIIIASLLSFLCVLVLGVGGVFYMEQPQLDDAGTTREEDEMKAEEAEVVYLDEEAIDRIPLWASSYNDAALRTLAMAAFNQVNVQRTSAGLKALVWDGNLEDASVVRSAEASQSFSHTRPDGTAWYTVNSRIQSGENLAYGYNSAEAAMSAWMASPTHAYNIMYNKFSKMGIACYKADNGKIYWAQEFGY